MVFFNSYVKLPKGNFPMVSLGFLAHLNASKEPKKETDDIGDGV